MEDEPWGEGRGTRQEDQARNWREIDHGNWGHGDSKISSYLTFWCILQLRPTELTISVCEVIKRIKDC
jgi:hypothetical protein